jgi:hydroxymethylpyrimidine kinase/phosphomethylpyrimidine kinase
MTTAGRRLVDFGCRAALVKGGHREGSDAVDVLVTDSSVQRFSRPRLKTRNTHGTGCTFSAAITACLAKGLDLAAAIGSAKQYIQAAIENAVPLGTGIGPLNHFAN